MYPNGQGSNIGTLLRLIQEDQSKNPAILPPGSEVGDPLRGVVQQPVVSPEAPGSSRVVSVRPEGVTQQGPGQEGVVLPPGGGGAAPLIAPAPGGVLNPIAPVARPAAPAPSGPPSSGGGGGQPAPSFSAPQAAPQAAPKVTVSSLPRIGTRIISTPKPSSVGGRIVQGNTQKKRSFA